jgi:hypothetical protein
MAKAAAGVTRSSQSAGPAGRTGATTARTIAAMTAVTAPALRRSTAPSRRSSCRALPRWLRSRRWRFRGEEAAEDPREDVAVAFRWFEGCFGWAGQCW